MRLRFYFEQPTLDEEKGEGKAPLAECVCANNKKVIIAFRSNCLLSFFLFFF